FESGSPLRIHLELEARDAVNDLIVGFSIRRSDGTLVSGHNTQVEHVRLPALGAGDCLCLAYTVDRLALLDGIGRGGAAAGAARTWTTFDWVSKAAQFSVTDVTGRTGVVQMGGAWELGPHAAAESR